MEKKKENYTMHDLCKAVGFRTVERAMNKEFITAVDEEMLKLIKKNCRDSRYNIYREKREYYG